jgi:membrane associated rhomboid family serine protease
LHGCSTWSKPACQQQPHLGIGGYVARAPACQSLALAPFITYAFIQYLLLLKHVVLMSINMYVCGCRGHVGGLAGGALVTWLLGPRLVRDPTTGLIVDKPPLPLLAHKHPTGPHKGGKQP